MQTIGQIICEKRKNRRWTKKRLAAEIDVCYSTITNWESNISLPNAIHCVALADAFGCTIDNLCGRDQKGGCK